MEVNAWGACLSEGLLKRDNDCTGGVLEVAELSERWGSTMCTLDINGANNRSLTHLIDGIKNDQNYSSVRNSYEP